MSTTAQPPSAAAPAGWLHVDGWYPPGWEAVADIAVHDPDLTPGDELEVDGERWRVESDAMGLVRVPAERLWGAQTQRSLQHFSIGLDRMPLQLARAYGFVKEAAAEANRELGVLDPERATLIVTAAREVGAGLLDAEFPLSVWQTGSGTQTNMNLNEVIANRANVLAGSRPGTRRPVHPNDHVNRSQSTNDTFPTAIHVGLALELRHRLLPEATALADTLRRKGVGWVDVVKIGRTHLQDATPLTVGQEWSGWEHQLRHATEAVRVAIGELHAVAVGGTAVGTGVTAPPRFGAMVAERLTARTGEPFVVAPNRFAALGGMDAVVEVSSTLRGLAVVLFKLANDLRWLGTGPRAGLHELNLPENEPGSSIMPGKVNPTQQEATMMVCTQVIADDVGVALAGTQGNFQLNVMRPVAAAAAFRQTRLLADAMASLRLHGVEGITLDEAQIASHVDRSLMLVTALSPLIGYDHAAEIAHRAHVGGTSLRDAALASGWVTPEQYDEAVDPARMVGDPRADLGLP